MILIAINFRVSIESFGPLKLKLYEQTIMVGALTTKEGVYLLCQLYTILQSTPRASKREHP